MVVISQNDCIIISYSIILQYSETGIRINSMRDAYEAIVVLKIHRQKLIPDRYPTDMQDCKNK